MNYYNILYTAGLSTLLAILPARGMELSSTGQPYPNASVKPKTTTLPTYPASTKPAAPETYPQSEATSKQLLIPEPSIVQKIHEILTDIKSSKWILSTQEYEQLKHLTSTMSPEERKEIFNEFHHEQLRIADDRLVPITQEYQNPQVIITKSLKQLTNDRNILNYFIFGLQLSKSPSSYKEKIFIQNLSHLIDMINAEMQKTIRKQLDIKITSIQPISQKELAEIAVAMEFMPQHDRSDLITSVFRAQRMIVKKTIEKYKNPLEFIDDKQRAIDKKTLENYLTHTIPLMSNRETDNFIQRIRDTIKIIDSKIETAQKKAPAPAPAEPVQQPTFVPKQEPKKHVEPKATSWELRTERPRTPYSQTTNIIQEELPQKFYRSSNIPTEKSGARQQPKPASAPKPQPEKPEQNIFTRAVQAMENVIKNIYSGITGFLDFLNSLVGK